MKNRKLIAINMVMLLSLTGCVTSNGSNDGNKPVSTGSDGKGGSRHVGHVRWTKEKGEDAKTLSEQVFPKNSSGVFFLRSADQDTLQTSANVAINGRFQSSIQPGNFSHVYSCSGLNDLSSEITGHKNNKLSKAVAKQEMRAGESYYFEVDVLNSGVSKIINLSAKDALAKMAGMNHQVHQISRVVKKCAPMSRIELKILFDTDKHNVKGKYYSEIEHVVVYMKKHKNTSVLLEGHTDSQASSQYNERLSQSRVDEVRKILIQKYKIDASRVTSKGYGESRPIATNNTASGRQQNRRVVAAFSINK